MGVRRMSEADPFRLDDKVALVTGAGRGLGRGIALALAAAGAEVLLNSRSPAELDALAGEIAAAGGRARPLPFDVTDTAAMRRAFAGIIRDLGRLDNCNDATCDKHHGDDAIVVVKQGVDPDGFRVIARDALELIGARRPSGAAGSADSAAAVAA